LIVSGSLGAMPHDCKGKAAVSRFSSPCAM